MARDWALIVMVIALVIGVYFAIAAMIDDLIEYWKAWHDDPGTPR